MPSKEVSQPIGSEPIKMVHLIPLAVYWSAYFGLGIYLKAPWAAIKPVALPVSEHRRLAFVDEKEVTRKDKGFQFEDLDYYKAKVYKELEREMILAEAEMIWVPRAMEGSKESSVKKTETQQSLESVDNLSEDSVQHVSVEISTNYGSQFQTRTE